MIGQDMVRERLTNIVAGCLPFIIREVMGGGDVEGASKDLAATIVQRLGLESWDRCAACGSQGTYQDGRQCGYCHGLGLVP